MKPLSCPLCCKLKFASVKDLMYHLERIRNNLTCPLCSSWCSDIAELVQHLNECSNSGLKDLGNTNNGPKQTNRENINNEDDEDDDEDDDEGFFCTVCNLKITSVNEHVQQFHSGQEVILQENEEEEEENNSLPTGSNRGTNIKMEKEDKVKRIPVPNGDIKPLNDSKEEEEDEQFYCTDCDFSFVSLKNHMAMYHEDEQLVLKEISGNLLVRDNTDGKNMCTYCGRRFKARSALTNHMKIHLMKDGRKLSTFRRPNGSLTGRKRVYKRRLISDRSLNDSQDDLGNDEESYQTVNSTGIDPSHDQDEQETSKPNNVIKHKVRTNLSMLKKNAKIRNNLKIRMPKYMLDKTKENVEVSKTEDVTVKKEVETEEDDDDENPLKCKVCKRLVLSKPALIQHMRKHPGEGAYKCKECHMKFTHLSTYINHTRLHTGRYPHYCHLCKRGFSYVSTLRVHMKKHNTKTAAYD